MLLPYADRVRCSPVRAPRAIRPIVAIEPAPISSCFLQTDSYLGEINDSQRAAWCQTIEAFDEGGQSGKQIALFPEDRAAPLLDCDVVHVRLSGLRLRRPRQWGGCWLACHLWD